jgi:adenine phosphoribosyltransferase
MTTTQDISNALNIVSDFPKPGVTFRDIGPLLANSKLLKFTNDKLYDLIKDLDIDIIAGVDARGFVFGPPLAERANCGFIMIRKANKMPNTISSSYDKEYGPDTLTIQEGLIPQGSKVLIVDDLIASGGTLNAAADLIERIGCTCVGFLCLTDLYDFPGRVELKYPLFSLLSFEYNSTSKFVKPELIEYIPQEPAVETDVIVFYHPSMKSLAEKVVAESSNFRAGTINWNHFPDGTLNISFEHLRYLENKKVLFFMSLTDNATFLEQLSVMMILPRQMIESLDIYITYFAMGTMERVEEEGILASAETVCTIISACLPPLRTGTPVIHMLDTHALCERFYFEKNVLVKMETAIELLKELITPDNTIICFPDDGACKRFKSSFKEYSKIICGKRRDGDRRIVDIVDTLQFPEFSIYDREVIIVDDLTQTGGTLNECKNALKMAGYSKISYYVTHGVFPNKNYKKFLGSTDIHKFYITNSIPEISDRLEEKAPFHVIHLETKIARDLCHSLKLPFVPRNNKNVLNIYVSSTTDVKLKAAYNSFSVKFPNRLIKVHGLKCDSGVNEQPIGYDETATGCENRLLFLMNHLRISNGVYVSIENGVFYKICEKDDVLLGDYFDFCVVSISYRDLAVFEIGQNLIKVPVHLITNCLKLDSTVTVGSLIEKHYGFESGHWHERLGAFSRFTQISNSLNKLVESNFLSDL